MYRIIPFLFSFILFSCGQKPQEDKEAISVTELDQAVPIQEVKRNSATQILIPHSYRDVLEIDFSQLDSTWLDLYFDKAENRWKIAATKYSITRSYDPCIGDSTTILSSSRNALLLFTGIQVDYNSLKSIKIAEEAIPPERKWDFSFNGKNYKLSAMGSVLDQTGYYIPTSDFKELNRADFEDYKIENYMLSLSTEDGQSQLLFTIPNLSDGIVKLLWVGDLDNDGRPDFVFNTATNEEEIKVELFLSSAANDSDFVKKAASVWIVFDC